MPYEFGESFTRHMVTAEWSAEEGWSPLGLGPFADLSLSPATVGLHYGQSVFEGLKAYRRGDGTVEVFRPADHSARFARSAERLAIPPLPDGAFLEALDLLLAVDQEDLPDDPVLSLYLRPLLFASEANLAPRPARTYTFLLIAFVTRGFFSGTVDAVTVRIGREYVRAVSGGTGDVKFGGNYAPAYLAQEQAVREGGQQVVWLDAAERRWVEELGAMNLFFVFGTGPEARLVTPPCSGTLLPGITRDSVMVLADRLGIPVSEEGVTVDQWRRGSRDGSLTETFACGTAAVVTPVGLVLDGEESWQVGEGKAGPVTLALRDALLDIHTGRAPAPDGWLRSVARG
ncbi:branched-chain amino acid aminotransferase [Streptomyces sp. NPDC002559]